MSVSEIGSESVAELPDGPVMVRELTVAEIRKIIAGLETQKESNLVDDLLDTVIPASAISLASGIDQESLELYAPSALADLAKAVEKVNFFLAEMIRRKISVYEELKGAVLEDRKN